MANKSFSLCLKCTCDAYSNYFLKTVLQNRSLKLGIWPNAASTTELSRPMSYSTRNPMDTSGLSWSQKRPRKGKETSLLTRSCLLALSVDGGAAGYESIKVV